MFRPFTGLSKGNSEKIRGEFYTIRDKGADAKAKTLLAFNALRESISDVEMLWNESEPDECIGRFTMASAAFNVMELKTLYRTPLLKAWLRAAFRKWRERGCDSKWDRVIEAFRHGIDDPQEADSVGELSRRVKDDEIGAYLILFPTVRDKDLECGSIASVHVRVIPRLDDEEPVLSVAPWSFFDWTIGDEEKLQQVLPGALHASGFPAEEVKRWHFVIELSPVGDAGCPWDLSAAAKEVLKTLEPKLLSIAGRSLELSVAIAAWAAHSQLSVSPLVATGQLEADGNISVVGGIEPKLGAIQKLKDAVPHLKMMFPSGNRLGAEGVLGLPGAQLPDDCYVTSLKELFHRPGLLTDGFDGYRAACAFEPPIQAEKTSEGRLTDTADLKSRECRLTKADWYRDSTVGDLEVLVMPSFDEQSPEKTALLLANQAMRLISNNEERGEQGQFPVAIAVSMKTLFDGKDWNHVLADCIERAIEGAAKLANRKDANGNRWVVRTDPEAMAIALRKPGKLVLVVYDEPSIVLWNRLGKDDQNFKNYEAGIKALKGLAEQNTKDVRRGTNWAPQQIVAICSDYRHGLLWDHEFNRSHELASPKS